MQRVSGRAKKFLKAAVFLLLFLLLFLGAQRLLQAKWTDSFQPTNAWDEYNTLEKNSIDVFFVGTSQIYSAVDPMYLYEETGITSYVLSGASMHFDMAYLVLREALRTQSPQVVFLDMSPIRYSGSGEEGNLRPYLDQFSLSTAKIDYVLHADCEDLNIIGALFPLIRYHSRWASLMDADFSYAFGNWEESYMRGHLLSYKIREGDGWDFYQNGQDTYEIPERAVTYLEKIAVLCEKNGIDLILCKIPALNWEQKWSVAAENYAEAMSLPYWEMFYDIDEMGVDAACDFRDGRKHMNQYGAEKVTTAFGQYLQEYYSMEDQRGINGRWEEDLVKYREEVGFHQ